MKKYLFKWKAFFLAFILLVTVLPIDTVSVYAAAKPAMSVKNKTVIGENQEFKLSIKNLTSSKVKSSSWYSTNKKVVTVYDGYVTSVGKGTAYIKCKITYKNGTVITPSCKVTVKIPATAIEITNAQDDITNNSRQVIAVGDTYDFNCVLTPANANNYITYSISNTDCATVDNKGVVKGKKPGFVTLTARARLTKPADYKNLLDEVLDLKDSINLEIVSKTASVMSVELTDTTTLTVTFDVAMDAKTLIGSNNQILNNITIITKSDSNGMIASSLGTLTGTLSTDGKTLTIKTSGYFNGLYSIKFSDSILNKNSEPLMEYYKELTLYDTTPPSYKNYTVDDTGLVASINFSEAMNFTGLKIEDVEQASGNTTAKSSTISRLSQKANYKATSDGKSLTIDLSQISSLDQNKQFKIVFSGLKDRAGNYPNNDRITTYLATDTSTKAQAALISLVRTDANTLTATFTRSIKTPGNVLLSNGRLINGVVKEDNTKQVTYTLDSESAKLTGKQEVNIGLWDSYNVSSSDTSSNNYKKVEVNFTFVTDVPELSDYQLVVETYNNAPVYSLVLTYTKDVTLFTSSGIFKAKLISGSSSSAYDYYIGYTAAANKTVVTVILDNDDISESGSYVITIPEDFVEDDYGNTNLETTVKVSSSGGSSSSALPSPKSIVQSSADASIIYVSFAAKLDEDTAKDISNYNISGAYVTQAELTDNTTNGATVKLTVMANTITESTKYSVTISGITGYHNSYTAMETYTTLVYLRENKGPGIVSTTFTYPDIITMTFDENVAGNASFQALQNGVDLVENCVISGKKIIITLVDKPTLYETINIVPTSSNNITDVFGNPVVIGSPSVTPTN